MLTVIVTGARTYNNKQIVFAALSHLSAAYGKIAVFTGDACGADALAREWAIAHHAPLAVFAAHWARYGRAAGPIRNKTMCSAARTCNTACALVAFPGGRGTASCIAAAKALAIPIWYPTIQRHG